ncbi:DUF3140 domain-containing protein [Streptomyces sp. NPDC090306]|uniref:DUF3140 domain-containing protein n=1 Tax=Streptomyces sp. NPDC090306 TaxID=3365961 RepID=UPI0038098372
MTDAFELDALWEEFHRLVNMTSPELAAWLQVREERAGHGPAEGEAAPGADAGAGARTGAETETGEQILAILQKRRMDLTDDDARVMYRVVDTVEEITSRAAPGTEAEADARRQDLMALGHDPHRASGTAGASATA